MYSTQPKPKTGLRLDALRGYFASGWLPFLPYIPVYILFWVFGGSVPAARTIFWCLHVLHLAGLTVVLIRSREIFRHPRFWFFVSIAVIFFIQGAYMEYPGDNWTHVRYIYLWNHTIDFDGWVPYKYKSGFFFLFTWIGWVPLHARFLALTICSSLVSVLLCYQIWRFLRACGLQEVNAFLGVVASLLFMGTPLQFHAYYALSSSSISMIAVFGALTALLPHPSSTPNHRRILLWFGGLTLTAFNHFQGIGLILIGSAAISCWYAQLRIGTAKVLTLLGGAAILAWVAGFLIIRYSDSGQQIWEATEKMRADGWISSFGSFRIWDLDGLEGEGASTRFFEIITSLGLLNIAAAAVLMVMKRPLGWISFFPFAAILYPVSATVVAYTVSFNSVIIYHRYLLLILPLAATIELTSLIFKKSHRLRDLGPFGKSVAASVALATVLLCAIPGQRHWLGKLGSLGLPSTAVERLAFLQPLAAQLAADPRLVGRRVATIADPVLAAYLVTHFGHYSTQHRLDVNGAPNPVFGSPEELDAYIDQFPQTDRVLCVIVPKSGLLQTELPLHLSFNGSVSRHWRTFSINEAFQFNPAILRWCETHLTLEKGWEILELDLSHRCYIRVDPLFPSP